MKTLIFKDYSAFLDREDKTVNGVSESFAENHPDYEKENEQNKGCWNCSGCSDCSGCSYCSYCSGCSHCSDCSGCSDCSYCSGCSHCSDCSDCSDCSYCSYCSDCSGCSYCSYCSGLQGAAPMVTENAFPEIPIIENIHQKVLEAVSRPNALEMGSWHTCDTTHCRAGWAVHLAGEKGYELERRTSALFAAQQIYKASSPIRVSPPRFYEDNKRAMEDITRCAEEEKGLVR